MKKLTVSILIIATILNLIQPIVLNASEISSEEETQSSYKGIVEDGTANIKTGENNIARAQKLQTSVLSGAITANLIALIGNGISMTANGIYALVVKEKLTEYYMFTIYDAVFNGIELFDINYLSNGGKGGTLPNKIHNQIKEQVEVWYYALRNVAIILSLCVLIYVGIRMAISALADDKAKYKKMLISWLQSFILIFFMHYIMLLSMNIADKLLDLIGVLKNFTGPQESFEINIFNNAWRSTFLKPGWDCVPDAILLWVLVSYQGKFFGLYLKRMISVAFLIIISPLITVTYPLDKMKDGKAQAFSAWIKEFEINIFIQPLHALFYLIFIETAGMIASKAPLLGVLFLIGLSRAEKIVKGIFNARGMKSINSMGKGKKE